MTKTLRIKIEMEDLPTAALVEIFKYGNVNALARTCKKLNLKFKTFQYYLLREYPHLFDEDSVFRAADSKIIDILKENLDKKVFSENILAYGKLHIIRKYATIGEIDYGYLIEQTDKVILYLLPHIEKIHGLIDWLASHGRKELAMKIVHITGNYSGMLGIGCDNCDLDMVKKAIRCGANEFEIASCRAGVRECHDIIDYMELKGVIDWNFVLHGAASANKINMMKYAIEKGANDFDSALLMAANFGSGEAAVYLIDSGAENIVGCVRMALIGGHENVLRKISGRATRNGLVYQQPF